MPLTPSGPAAPYLLLTPLPAWRGATQPIASGMCIRRLFPPERAVIDLSDTLLLYHDVDTAARDGYWLCYDFENGEPSEDVGYRRRREAAFKRLFHALYAIQILLPIGAANLFLLYRLTDAGLSLESSRHRPKYTGTQWAGICDVPAPFGEEVSVVLDRVQDVFQKPTLRLQIPIWLLEQGLTAPDRHIRILLWATGLDGISRSGGIAAFAERLSALLGSDTQIFPGCATLRRPKYKVTDVVEDLYLLRTEMAHGLPFHEKFRKKTGLLGDDDQPIGPDYGTYRYDHVLEESSGLLLCRALKEILIHNLAFDVRSKNWAATS